MRKRHGALLALAILSLGSFAAERDEEPVDDGGEAPGPVTDEVRRRWPNARLRTVARHAAPDLGDVWEVEVREGYHARHVSFTATGETLGERESVPTSAVAPEALDAVARRFGRASIWHAERLDAGDEHGWALTFSRGGQLGEALVDEDGHVLAAALRRS